MKALTNNDTTGGLLKRLILYRALFYLSIVSLLFTEIFIQRMGILGELPKDEMLAKLKLINGRLQILRFRYPGFALCSVTAGAPGRDVSTGCVCPPPDRPTF